MARNVIENYFRSSKMAIASHFVKKIQIVYSYKMARKCDQK